MYKEVVDFCDFDMFENSFRIFMENMKNRYLIVTKMFLKGSGGFIGVEFVFKIRKV